jgi:L-alanine-DL-glutamate epimerase-like enolase superfamily enzyme
MHHRVTDKVPIERLDVSVYTVPTENPETDGTREWDSTTIIVVEPTAGGKRGLGYAYGDAAAARLINDVLRELVRGSDAMAIAGTWTAMVRALRESGRPGVSSTAVSAIDLALWDLKARLLELPLVTLLGAVREAMPIYGSGGFTSYSLLELQRQIEGWVSQGISRVKIKVGRDPNQDCRRVAAAREALGKEGELMVDANGAYDRKQALAFAERFAESGATWFEEPVSSDDLEGLRLLRDRAPSGMDIAAGEYGFDLLYFRRMLEFGAVDVLQPDARRCGGITGFLRVGALCEAYSLPLSSHTAPALHLHPCCALEPVRHVEYFHDHVRIEAMLFDGVPPVLAGALSPDLSRPGFGLELKHSDAAPYARE